MAITMHACCPITCDAHPIFMCFTYPTTCETHPLHTINENDFIFKMCYKCWPLNMQTTPFILYSSLTIPTNGLKMKNYNALKS
jgi:hypothetical protein